MTREYFTESEAAALAGKEIEAISPLQRVPIGTHGVVVGAQPAPGGCELTVEWETKKRPTQYFSSVLDVSLNVILPRRGRRIRESYTKEEFERCTKPLT